ncbi:MAG: hypothetical protein J5585_01295 [Clostridia bacterium]|nr:hypothetical protein [Clostridia bacterium]
MPEYKRASFSGESVVLENENIKVNVCKRISGYGFAEIYSGEGRLLAVLDHFGEVKLRDQDIPMRLEAEKAEKTDDGYTFNVFSCTPAKRLENTSFAPWIGYPFENPVLHGTVKLKLEEKSLRVETELYSDYNVYAEYLRLLWLYCGEGSYGIAKTDALLPGVDWPVGDEWSSGTDFFKDPWADRRIPHPNKIASPFMAVSHGGDCVSVEYSLDTPVMRWFNYNEYYAQPVFAAPNFIERQNNSLLGIMIPDVKTEDQENKPFAAPFEIHKGQRITFSAQITVGKGTSIDALADFVKRSGMPKPQPVYTPDEALERIATAYNTNLYHDGKGFGYVQGGSVSITRTPPTFLRRFIADNPGTTLSAQLREKIAESDSAAAQSGPKPTKEELCRRGDTIIGWQREDGAFCFDPDGRHYGKDDFVVARSFIDPMAHGGDTALYLNTVPALELIHIYEKTGEKKYFDAACKSLDLFLDAIRPEGGDYWETPLHAPNLLAAGHAANTYYYVYKNHGVERYRERAVHFLRTLLAFTHLRRPKNVPSLYNTKPCLCCSDWYFANWVRDFVQWEVLHCIVHAKSLGIRWEEIDPGLDWLTYVEGVTTATYNWMADHKKNNWRPHNIPSSYPAYERGEFDGCFSDTFNSVTGNTGGMFIHPSTIADCIYYFKDEK